MIEDERRQDETEPPVWPAPPVEGEPVPLPGFEDVPTRPAERPVYPT